MDFPEFARRKLAAAGVWELGWFGGDFELVWWGQRAYIYIYIQNSFMVTSVWTVLTLNSLLIGYIPSFVGFHLCISQI